MPNFRAFQPSIFVAGFVAAFVLRAQAQILPPAQTVPAHPASAHTASAPAHVAPQSGSYRIAGTLVDAISGQPLVHATVAVLSEEDSHTIAAVQSDSDGRFALEQLAAAKYQFTASKRGYRTAFYDEHDLYNSAVVTGPDQDTGNLIFQLVPGAVLRGTVTTDGGDPVENARVMLYSRVKNGKAGGHIAQASTEITDDTGAYEFDSLAAGDYLVAVVAEPWYAMHSSGAAGPNKAARTDPPAALDVAYPVTYFDSSTEEASATPLTLSGGGHDQADITLHAVAALHITVDTPKRPDGSIVRAEMRQTVFGTVVGTQVGGFVDATQAGATEFNGVAPGHYELVQGDPPRAAQVDATASARIDLAVGTATVQVRGTLRATSGAPVEDSNVVLIPPDSGRRDSQNPTTFSSHGAFTFPAVPPGQWQLLVQTSGKESAVNSLTFGGHTHSGNILNVEDRPLAVVVTLGQGSTSVQGFARRDGKGVAGVMVLLVPAEMTALDVTARRDQSDSDGSFSLHNVVPGQYTLMAIQDGWGLDWAEPTVIARYLPGGIPVTVADDAGKLTPLSTPVAVQNR
jgi:hypothetical protein